MSIKLKTRIFFIGALLSWVLFSFLDTYIIILTKYQMKESLAGYWPQLFFTLFVISTFFYFRYIITKAESINFMELLWRVFITGMITTLCSIGMRLLLNLFTETAFGRNAITINFFYHIYVGLVVTYLLSTFVVWKRLILYQKTKHLVKLWRFFEYAFLIALVIDIFKVGQNSTAFYVIFTLFSLFSLILSFNLNWVAYLNTAQKWRTILFILLSGVYLYHFFLNLTQYSSSGLLTLDLMERTSVVGMLVFIFIYATVSVLVTLFNVPTSSVFERKLQEAVDFQKLSQSVPTGKDETETLEILLDSSMSAVFADAGWIELRKQDGSCTFLRRNLKEQQLREILSLVKSEELIAITNFSHSSTHLPQKNTYTINKGTYRSLMVMPIYAKGQQVAVLILLQEVAEAFNREMTSIISTFVSQAGVAIENARLLNEALENERYKEQLKIAKLVQQSLLPKTLGTHPGFEMAAFTVAADEVGGDYYDIIDWGECKFGIIIGDVSGKGTSAAFNMAQMKGIFHSLSKKEISPSIFASQANDALTRCLEKSAFITAAYFSLDSHEKKIKFIRAGHCHPILFRKSRNQIEQPESKGLALGILPSSEYYKHIIEKEISVESDDVLLLYTDGITEATNKDKIQYGTLSLQSSLKRHAYKNVEGIKQGLVEDLYLHIGQDHLEDDCTLLLIKFK